MIDRLKRFDWVLFLAMAALIAVGTVFIWSAGNARAETVFHDSWKSTLVTALVGLAPYFALAFADYRKVLGLLAVPAYVVSLLMLVLVLFVGSRIYGGSRWLWFFQPSEIAKLCVLSLVAVLFGGDASPVARFRATFRGFLLAGAILGVPVLLILAEPDLGTALTLVPATVLMVFAAGTWRRGLVTLATVGGLGVLFVLGAVYEAEKPGAPAERRERILRYVPLKPHQVKRVKVFLFPEEDVTGAGYNLRQAQISIGSGGLTGKGVGKGETNHLKYLPQAISMNDFIFCVLAEETGFRGSLVLLGLFGLLLLDGCRVAFWAADGCGRLFALGFMSLVFAHVYINIAMSLGLVPITGLPLPFISSGRTFLLTMMCGLGLVQSISIHREEIKK